MRESRFWFLSLAAAPCLIVLLGIHLFLMHLETLAAYLGIHNSDPLGYAAVMARGKSLAWVVTYLALLLLALYHGLYGLRSIVLEAAGYRQDRAITWTIIGLGLVAFTVGSYVVIRSYTMGGI